jgi:hypothetical protein
MRAVTKPRGSEGRGGLRTRSTVCPAIIAENKTSVRRVASIATCECVGDPRNNSSSKF